MLLGSSSIIAEQAEKWIWSWGSKWKMGRVRPSGKSASVCSLSSIFELPYNNKTMLYFHLTRYIHPYCKWRNSHFPPNEHKYSPSSHCICHWLHSLLLKFCHCPTEYSLMLLKLNSRASLVAQWLRIRLPTQGTRVQALVREGPTCHGATKPVRHNYWARVPQLLKPAHLEPMLHSKEKPPQ